MRGYKTVVAEQWGGKGFVNHRDRLPSLKGANRRGGEEQEYGQLIDDNQHIARFGGDEVKGPPTEHEKGTCWESKGGKERT